MSNHSKAILIVIMSGLIWSFGPLVVKNMTDPKIYQLPYLVIRGLRTLDVRLEKHEKNAKEVIKFLSKQKKIVEILYPYKKGTKNYKNWKKYVVLFFNRQAPSVK